MPAAMRSWISSQSSVFAELTVSAAMPARRAAAIWSRMSASSGETTNVGPAPCSRSRAVATKYTADFPHPVRWTTSARRRSSTSASMAASWSGRMTASGPASARMSSPDRSASAVRRSGASIQPFYRLDMPPTATLRLARLDDAEAIRQIYNAEVQTSTVTFDIVPRSLDEQRRYLTDRSGAHAVIVAEDEGVVVGYGALSPWRSKPAYATSVEDSVYIHRDHQGRGIGRTLLDEMLRVGTAHGFHAVFARIVGGHEASIRLHEAAGFEIVGTEREVGRKFGRWLDVVLMERLLGSEAPTAG